MFKNENYTYRSKMLTLRLLGTEDSRLVSSISCSLTAKNSPCGQRTKSTDLPLSAFHTHILNLTYINTCYCTVTFTSERDFLTSMNKFLSQTSMRVRLNITNSFIKYFRPKKKKQRIWQRCC